MKKLCLLLGLCLTLSACSAPAETQEPSEVPETAEPSELTAEEAREALTQALLDWNPSFLSYSPETGFETGGIHYVWSEENREDMAEDTEVYCFDLCYGPDADDGLEDAANPMPGRLCMACGIGKDGEGIWVYHAELGEWKLLPKREA